MAVDTELVLRSATLEDATFAADLWTALRPDAPNDPVLMRYWWEFESPTWLIERFIVERDGASIGLATHERPHWDRTPERYASVGGDLLPAARDPGRLAAVFASMEDRARRAGAKTLRIRANEDDEVRLGVIRSLAYREDRRSRRWELDLVANRDRLLAMAEESRARMRAQGIRVLALAEDTDPEKYVKIWRMSEEATQDIPTTLPHVPESFEDYLRWFRSPDIREDRFWIARVADDIVGVSVLSYPPVRGVVGTDWTATARSVRGRGVARALKCETVAQAIALGVDRVRTGNDAANAPILHLNETMGYRPIPGAIEFLKDAVRSTMGRDGVVAEGYGIDS